MVSFLRQYAISGTLAGVDFGGKELAWSSKMRPRTGNGKFGGAVEGGIGMVAFNRLRLVGKERFS